MRTASMGLAASLIAGVVAAQLASAQQTGGNPPARPKQGAPMTSPANDPIFKEIEQTVGFVPQFFRMIPDSQLPSFWSSMKTFQMNTNTALDVKTKELIGLAVAAQVPCDYCTYFHTEAAKAAGATDQQIREAIGMAAMTRMGSTLLNGLQIDQPQFRKDVQRMFKTGDQKKNPQTSSRP